MKFGGMVATKIDDWEIFKELEDLGYDSAWAPDSQMIWSDCYATLSLAAYHTSRICLGTGVAIAGTRLAPVTAHSIASINKLAPGRTFLGIGTGHTAMRIMGPPVQVRILLGVEGPGSNASRRDRRGRHSPAIRRMCCQMASNCLIPSPP